MESDPISSLTINQFRGRVGMIFITHAMPKNLQVDEIVRIGKGSLGVVPTQPERKQEHMQAQEMEGGGHAQH